MPLMLLTLSDTRPEPSAPHDAMWAKTLLRFGATRRPWGSPASSSRRHASEDVDGHPMTKTSSACASSLFSSEVLDGHGVDNHANFPRCPHGALYYIMPELGNSSDEEDIHGDNMGDTKSEINGVVSDGTAGMRTTSITGNTGETGNAADMYADGVVGT